MERRRLLAREEGQSLIVMVLVLVVLLGFAGIVIDFGRAYIAQRQLQQAVDAAALAAGQSLPNSAQAQLAAVDYSATSKNAHPAGMDASSPAVTFRCLQTLKNANMPCLVDTTNADAPCSANAVVDGTVGQGCNAVQVKQTATVPTLIAKLFRFSNWTVTARATAGMRGGVPHPLDIMIALDRTGSMDEDCDDAVRDPNTGSVVISANQTKKIDCAKAGIRQLLRGLLPCNTNVVGNCGAASPLDQVGLITFPPLKDKDATTHDRYDNPQHSNIALESSASCSGNLRSTPYWYVNGGGGSFPNKWFIRNDDVTYGSSASAASASITINQRSGSFTITIGGQTTPALAWNATAAQVQAAVQALPSVGAGNATVTKNNNTFTINFAVGLGNVGNVTAQAVAQSQPDPVVATTRPGSNGQTGINEVQTVRINQSNGQFRLRYNGQWTDEIDYNASAGTVESELIELRGIRNGDIAVTKSPSNGAGTYTITFQGTLAATNVPQITGDRSWGNGSDPTTLTPTQGVPAGRGQDEVQTVQVTQNGGTFTLTFNGQTTDPIPYDASANTVEDALTDLNNIRGNDVNVTKNPWNGVGTYTITFQNNLGEQDVSQLVATAQGSLEDPTVNNIAYLPATVADYVFAPLSNDFRQSDLQGLNPASRLVQGITWSSCQGGIVNGYASESSSGYPGNSYYGITSVGNTYYTGALIAAQNALSAAAAANPTRDAQQVIILLSDGEANTGANNPCSTAIDAAHNSALSGTWVYSIAYKLSNSVRCQNPDPPLGNGNDESPRITAYHTMAQIARDSTNPDQPDPSKFFCVGTTSLPSEPCQSGDTLAEVFQSIGTSLTASRLFPDDTQ